jgi:hypothetical protein
MAHNQSDQQVGFLDPSYAALARELAQDIRPIPEVLKDYGFTDLDDPRWLFLQRSNDFKRMLAEASKEWNAADSTRRRVQQKALASLEMSIPNIHHLVNTSTTAPTARIDGARLLQSIAGMAGPVSANMGDGGSGVSININFGGNSLKATLQPKQFIEGEAQEVGDE